jgi:hypothetical protein
MLKAVVSIRVFPNCPYDVVRVSLNERSSSSFAIIPQRLKAEQRILQELCRFIRLREALIAP